MSGEAIGWAFRKVQMDDPTAKFVLVAICNYANENEEAWPSHAAIARISGLSKRTIQNSLKKLEDWGIISRIRQFREDGSETSALTSVDIEKAWIVENGVARVATAAESGSKRVTQQVREGVAPDASLETTLKPKEETTLFRNEWEKPTAPTVKPKKIKHQIPINFAITEDHMCFARERNFEPAEARLMFEKFKAYHQGKGSLMLDWNACWRTWVLNQVGFRDARDPSNHKPYDNNPII